MRSALGALGLGAFACGADPFVMAGLLTRVAEDLGVGIVAVTFLADTAAFAVCPYLGPLFADAGPAGLGELVAAFGVGAVAGTWVGGRAADRFGPTPTSAVVVSVFAPAQLSLAVVAGSLPGGLLYALVRGLAGWATIPAQQRRLIARLGPRSLAGAAVIRGPGADRLWILATAAALLALVLVGVGARTRKDVCA